MWMLQPLKWDSIRLPAFFVITYSASTSIKAASKQFHPIRQILSTLVRGNESPAASDCSVETSFSQTHHPRRRSTTTPTGDRILEVKLGRNLYRRQRLL